MIKDVFNQFKHESAAFGFDAKRDYYEQEIEKILAAHKGDETFTLYDLAEEHCRLRGFGQPLPGREEHDAAHIIMGLIFDRDAKAGVTRPQDRIDFQTGRYIEVFANDLEQKISPAGAVATYHKNHPEAFHASPFHPAIDMIAESVESEENYLKTLCWLIGGHVKERSANIRYMYGVTDAKTELEKIAGDLGYKTSFRLNGSAEHFATEAAEWTIETPAGAVYASGPGKNPVFPSGSNGVETFLPLKFPDQERSRALYNRAEPVIARIRDKVEDGKTIEEALRSINVSEALAIIEAASTYPSQGETLLRAPKRDMKKSVAMP